MAESSVLNLFPLLMAVMQLSGPLMQVVSFLATSVPTWYKTGDSPSCTSQEENVSSLRASPGRMISTNAHLIIPEVAEGESSSFCILLTPPIVIPNIMSIENVSLSRTSAGASNMLNELL